MKRKLFEAKLSQKYQQPTWEDEIQNTVAKDVSDAGSDSDSSESDSSLDAVLEKTEIPDDSQILAERKESENKKRNLVPYVNKQRTLLFSSRGTNSLARHLIEDLRALLINARKEAKHDMTKKLYEINELCEIRDCNNCIFFESKKHSKIRDLYMWVSKCPTGPSVRFLVSNISTMDEMRLTGNCLKGSRPVLSFSKEFSEDVNPHMAVVKQLLEDTFGVPRGHPKSKPFTDHVFSFSMLDGRIWFRNFQILATENVDKPFELVEIGPRFVLSLDKIFSKGFGGEILYENPGYVKPTLERRGEREILAQQAQKAMGYENKLKSNKGRNTRQAKNKMPHDPLKDVF